MPVIKLVRLLANEKGYNSSWTCHSKLMIKSNYKIKNKAKLIYVSPIWKFKDHISILNALKRLKKLGYKFEMTFVGEFDRSPTK